MVSNMTIIKLDL